MKIYTIEYGNAYSKIEEAHENAPVAWWRLCYIRRQLQNPGDAPALLIKVDGADFAVYVAFNADELPPQAAGITPYPDMYGGQIVTLSPVGNEPPPQPPEPDECGVPGKPDCPEDFSLVGKTPHPDNDCGTCIMVNDGQDGFDCPTCDGGGGSNGPFDSITLLAAFGLDLTPLILIQPDIMLQLWEDPI